MTNEEIVRLITELQRYNIREVELRRVAMNALRTVLARIEGTVAADWIAPDARSKPEAQYPGTLAEFLRTAIAEASGCCAVGNTTRGR